MAGPLPTRTTTDPNSAADINTLNDAIGNVTGITLFDNAIINPNGKFVQRVSNSDIYDATGPYNNDGDYVNDMWSLETDGNDVFDVSHDASESAIKLDVETSKRGGIAQILRNEFTTKYAASGKASISCLVKSANIVAARIAIVEWDGTVDNPTLPMVTSWAATPTLAAGWTFANTPSDLTVTSAYTTIKVNDITLASGTDNLAMLIWLPNEETITDVIFIKNVVFSEGSNVFTYRDRHPSIEQTLVLENGIAYTGATNQRIGNVGIASGGGTSRHNLVLGVPMWKIPNVIQQLGTMELTDIVTANKAAGTLSLAAEGTRTNPVLKTAGSGYVVGTSYELLNVSAGGKVFVGAEIL